jgi:hypothetical protein
MLSDALFWSGQHVCEALNSIGIDYSTISACGANQRVMGFLVVSWLAVMLIVWKLLISRI